MRQGFLTGNLALDLGILSWFVAQVLKIVIEFAVQRKLDVRTFVRSGGMPSSHSSFVCALACAIGQLNGWYSPMFALSAGMACVVMYDACNVRRAAGEQAKVLNDLIAHLDDFTPQRAERALKELLGHTPSQVVMGALLGCTIGLVGAGLVG